MAESFLMTSKMEKGLRVEKIIEILESTKDKNGYISKKTFQLKIANLREEKIVTPVSIGVNNRDYLVGAINSYRRKVRHGTAQSSLMRKKIDFFNSLEADLRQGITFEEIEFLAFSDGDWRPLCTPYGEITSENFVAHACELQKYWGFLNRQWRA